MSIVLPVAEPVWSPIASAVDAPMWTRTLAQQIAALHAKSTQSLWLDPSDLSTLYQDSAGTVQGANKFRVMRANDRSGKGNHTTQSTETDAPYLVDEMVLWFDSGDSLSVTFADALGSDCTVASAVPGTGVDIQTGVTIGSGAYSISADTAGFMLFDRALTARETSLVTRYLEMKLAILEFVEFDFNALPIDPRITFTRASTGTYFDADGVMQTAAINQPRIDHDPVTGAVRGLLVEEQRTNLLRWSQGFDNTVWNKNNFTVSANSGVAPDGTLTADTCVVTSTNTATATNSTAIAATSTAMTYSIYTKKGNVSTCNFLIRNHTTATNFVIGVFNYDTGTISGAGWFVKNVGGGWFRLIYTQTTGINVGDELFCYYGATGSPRNAGDTWLVWGAQLEAGPLPTSYIPTEGTAMTRAADVSNVSDTADIRLNPTAGTFLVEHDAPAGRPLLSSGANLIAASQGHGVLAVAYDGSGSLLYQNGVSAGSGAALAFDTGLRIGASASEKANACIRRARYYSRKLSPSEIAGVWA